MVSRRVSLTYCFLRKIHEQGHLKRGALPVERGGTTATALPDPRIAKPHPKDRLIVGQCTASL